MGIRAGTPAGRIPQINRGTVPAYSGAVPLFINDSIFYYSFLTVTGIAININSFRAKRCSVHIRNANYSHLCEADVLSADKPEDRPPTPAPFLL